MKNADMTTLLARFPLLKDLVEMRMLEILKLHRHRLTHQNLHLEPLYFPHLYQRHKLMIVLPELLPKRLKLLAEGNFLQANHFHITFFHLSKYPLRFHLN